MSSSRFSRPTAIKVHQVAMVGGEVSPSLWHRTDLEKIKISLAKCRNFIPFAHGGVEYRHGTWFVAQTKQFSGYDDKVILIPMSFTQEHSIHIEVGHLYMRFYVDGAPIMDGTVPYEIVSPYSRDDLPYIRYVQSADTIFLVDGYHAPYRLNRYSNTNWELVKVSFENGPFLKENLTSTTLELTSVSGSTGLAGETVNVTASSDTFDASDIGRLIKINYIKEAKLLQDGKVTPAAAWTGSAVQVDGQFEVTYSKGGSEAPELQFSVDGGTTWETYYVMNPYGETTKVDFDGELRSEDYNNIIPQLRLYASTSMSEFQWTIRQLRERVEGILEITSYTSPTSVQCEVKTRTTYLDKPTKKWALGAWGDVPGWPAVVTFHQDRLTFGRTASSPFDIWQSVSGDYTNFGLSSPVQDDDLVKIPIRSRTLDDIQGIVSLRDLIVLTSGGEWKVSGSAEGNAITPSSMYVSNQGYRGSSDIEPLIVGPSILFVQRFGTRIRDLAYSFESDGYDSNDLSIFAEHLFSGYSVVSWCYQQEPDSILWVVRSDGKLIGLTYVPEQNVWAWHLHDVGGEVEAISSAPGVSEDEVYIVVKRIINGSAVRYVERFSAKSDMLHMDCSVVAHDGVATSSITGLDYLEGQTVVVIADDLQVFGKVVTGGTITLDTPAEWVVVGLGYTGEIQTLPMVYEANDGVSTGSRRRSSEIILQVLDSRHGYVGTNDDSMYPIHYPEDESGLYSGVLIETLESSYDYYGQVTIKQNYPLPLKILNWTVRVLHGD